MLICYCIDNTNIWEFFVNVVTLRLMVLRCSEVEKRKAILLNDNSKMRKDEVVLKLVWYLFY